MPTSDPRRDDDPSPIAPPTPEGLARAYGEISAGYHRRLPELERLAREARDAARSAIGVAAESRKAAEQSAELAGKSLARLDDILLAVTKRSPSLPDIGKDDEDEEVTLDGKKLQVEDGNVTLTKSDYARLKRTSRVVRFAEDSGRSLLQKVLVGVVYAGLLMAAGLIGAGIRDLWHAAHPQVIQAPPIVVSPVSPKP